MGVAGVTLVQERPVTVPAHFVDLKFAWLTIVQTSVVRTLVEPVQPLFE